MPKNIEMIKETVNIPEGIDIQIDKKGIHAKGPKGEISRKLIYPGVEMGIKDKNIIITCKKITKREKSIIGTFKAHINNIIAGVQEGYKYKLKICSSHFPMNVSVNNREFVIKNFFGEKIPRKLKIKEGAEVKIEGNIITIESIDKEIAGQVAADIETLTKRTKYDRRIFQDGCFIIMKAGKDIK